jgi:hypothetical protein
MFMFSRRREQWIVILGLVAVNAAFGWYLYRQWKDYKSRTRWIYSGVQQAGSVLPSAPKARSVEGQDFAEIVNRNLFRQDRSNVSATEEAKMPELPILFGTMNLGKETFALMTPADRPSDLSKQVFPGQDIGGYKLVSIGGSQVVVEWGEKQFTINVWESARKLSRVVDRPAPARQGAAASGTTAGEGSRVTTVAPNAGGSSSGGRSQATGFAGFAAPPGAKADTPPGTVINGKRKVVHQTMFGPQVWWEDVKPSTTTAGKDNEKKEN